MRKEFVIGLLAIGIMMAIAGCDFLKGPEKKGEFRLSSEKFGTTSYHLLGYVYEESELFRYPFKGDQIPDIINEGYLVIEEGAVASLPGFNTPGQKNGFALVGEFESVDGARDFYKSYKKVEDGLQFETISDTVELNQVWVQKTESGNYVKLLVKRFPNWKGESGSIYNEVHIEYTYQPDGSLRFSD